MKATELQKKSITINELYKYIDQANENGEYKYYISSSRFISDDVKLQLMQDGFKVRIGLIYNDPETFIIEW